VTVPVQGLDLTGSEQGPVAGCCECDNGAAASFKGWEFYCQLNDVNDLPSSEDSLLLYGAGVVTLVGDGVEDPWAPYLVILLWMSS
jgi:hypothetical protein